MRILVIRFSSIGDIVQSTSPLATLKTAYPDSQIDFLTLSAFKPILAAHPHINTTLSVDRTTSLKELIRYGKTINGNQYDLVVDLHGSLRSKLIRSFVRATKKVVQKKPRWKRMLLKEFHLNTYEASYSYKQMLHQTIRDLVPDTDKYPNTLLALGKEELDTNNDFLQSHGIHSPFTVIVPGAAWKFKQWNSANYSQLINELTDNNIQVIILGAKRDKICDEIDTSHPSVINLKGKTTLRESIRVIASANNCIGSDTGLIHAAEALGIPVISILGPTGREMGAGVQLPESKNVEDTQLWCRPCSQNGSRPCYRKRQYCMENITVEQVLSGYHLMAKV